MLLSADDRIYLWVGDWRNGTGLHGLGVVKGVGPRKA
jgi:hypothetical protein